MEEVKKLLEVFGIQSDEQKEKVLAIGLFIGWNSAMVQVHTDGTTISRKGSEWIEFLFRQRMEGKEGKQFPLITRQSLKLDLEKIKAMADFYKFNKSFFQVL